MGPTVFFLVSFLISSTFIVMKKKLSIIENTFVYLMILVLSINASWILDAELKLINVTSDPVKFAAFLLFRSIITPVLIVVQLNILKRFNSKTRTLLITSISIGILLLLRGLTSYFEILTYTKWNYGYDAIYFLLLHFIAFYSYKFIRNMGKREVKYS